MINCLHVSSISCHVWWALVRVNENIKNRRNRQNRKEPTVHSKKDCEEIVFKHLLGPEKIKKKLITKLLSTQFAGCVIGPEIFFSSDVRYRRHKLSSHNNILGLSYRIDLYQISTRKWKLYLQKLYLPFDFFMIREIWQFQLNLIADINWCVCGVS